LSKIFILQLLWNLKALQVNHPGREPGEFRSFVLGEPHAPSARGAHENIFRHIHDLCMSNGVEGRRGVSPHATGGLERLNYAAFRRVHFEALFSEQSLMRQSAFKRMKRFGILQLINLLGDTEYTDRHGRTRIQFDFIPAHPSNPCSSVSYFLAIWRLFSEQKADPG
jgi:hypothetical protein